MNNELSTVFQHVTSARRQYRHLPGEGMVYDLHIGLDTTDPWAMGGFLHNYFGRKAADSGYVAGATCRFLGEKARGPYSHRDPSKVLVTVSQAQGPKVRAFLKDLRAFQKRQG